MKFSFVVPVYNVEMYLERCLDSILAQTYQDYEVLLINDGSTDGSEAICAKYANRYSKVKFYTKENGGLSDARNYGIDRAVGDYIIFVDSDDYIDSATCEKIMPFTINKPDIIRCNAVRVENGSGLLRTGYVDKEKLQTGPEYLKQMIPLGQMPMAAWLNVYAREFLSDNKIAFKKGILHEDEEFTPRVFLAAERVIDANIVFYYYVIREDSITTQKDKRKNAKDMLSTCYELEEIFSKLSDLELKKMLLDSLVSKYLSIYNDGALMKYGENYLPKKFLKRNTFLRNTKLKVWLVCFSPQLYRCIHMVFKKL